MAATDWTTGIAQATAPVIAALRRNSRRFTALFSFSAIVYLLIAHNGESH
ncbi:MAG TPA: hypothetical protein VE737_06075 [Actinomycetota bacterium]|nr:hypothetical protein [Actinomycetota bacterium]